MNPRFYVDNTKHPKFVLMYAKPAYFIVGEPEEEDLRDVFGMIEEDSWLIPEDIFWDKYIEEYFKGHVESHKRVLFNSENVSLEKIRSLKTDISKEFKIVPIAKEHITEGIIHDDVIKRFFSKSDFLNHGFGFALVDQSNTPLGFSLTNFPIYDDELEVYFRVGFEDEPENRKKGIGTLLAIYFVEAALERGYVPVWDSANDISSHIAKKLGYKEDKVWYMYHILNRKNKS
jgi:GNAT superfamily N-acetyltransferase